MNGVPNLNSDLMEDKIDTEKNRIEPNHVLETKQILAMANASAKQMKDVNDSYFGAYGTYGIHREMIGDKSSADDVGQAILESYSRILKSLAHTVMSRIEDVIYADSMARDPSLENSRKRGNTEGTLNIPNSEEKIQKLNCMKTPTSMTLSDFIGWHIEQDEDARKMDYNALNSSEDPSKITRLHENAGSKRVSYIESLGALNSPTKARY
ncbi:hypothetical protein ZOSMA_15G00070 [Zostera marina]|uniref:PRONE domain-containing protein n=1 Tax=Zostera marina TaxID=29655 RepID=A0A0K9PUK6_ZOSMR|nr:hypothetical protein ZOSMA_15G00070 [Zostera marina]